MNRGIALALMLGSSPLAVSAGTLEERVEVLEQRGAELYHTLEEKKTAGVGTKIGDDLSISGLIELEGTVERLRLRNGSGETKSDLVLTTAELGFEAGVTERTTAILLFLFEEDSTAPLEVDEAYVRYARGGWFGRFGRQYLPFGEFLGHFVSDPPTSELAETRETALLLGYEHEFFSLAAFWFHGDVGRAGDGRVLEDELIGDWGGSLKVTAADSLECRVSFLSDLADADVQLVDEYRRRIAGWSAFAAASVGPMELSGEVVGSFGAFDGSDLDANGDGAGDRPLAWNLELAWDVTTAVEVAARVAGSRELASAPRLQYGIDVSWGSWEHMSVSLEYLHEAFDKDFGVDADGRVLDTRDLLAGQLAVEF